MAEISVIIPVYNVEKYVGKCIESVLAQTFQDFELILVDDGSTDTSGAVCDAYGCRDRRITVIHKENGGPSYARNCGLEKNKNEYIVFIDADDYIDTRYLEILYQSIKERNADIGICCETDVEEIDDIKLYKFNYQEIMSKIETISKVEAYKRMMMPGNTSVCAWGKIYHKKVFRAIRYPVGEIYEDCKIIDQIIEKSNKIVYIPYAGYFYLIRQGSITHGEITPGHMAAVDNAKHLFDLVKNKYPEIEEVALEYYWRESIHLFSTMLLYPEYKEQCRYLRGEILKERKKIFKNMYIDFESKCSICCLFFGIRFYKISGKIYYKIRAAFLRK